MTPEAQAMELAMKAAEELAARAFLATARHFVDETPEARKRMQKAMDAAHAEGAAHEQEEG